MVIGFTEQLDLPPIPVDAGRAAVQGRVLARKIAEAGDVDVAIDAAVAAMHAGAGDDNASELGRLRALYVGAYTDNELRSLVWNTFVSLGLARPADGEG